MTRGGGRRAHARDYASIRDLFVNLLAERHRKIAEHALTAWESDDPEIITGNLREAQAILHQISSTAGLLGFADVGVQAVKCEAAIALHLEMAQSPRSLCPRDLIERLDDFVGICRSVLEAPAPIKPLTRYPVPRAPDRAAVGM